LSFEESGREKMVKRGMISRDIPTPALSAWRFPGGFDLDQGGDTFFHGRVASSR
jgi:hypothetical protein